MREFGVTLASSRSGTGDWDLASEGRWVRVMLPLLIGVVLLAATLWLWRLQVEHDRREALLALKGSARWLADQASRRIEAEIDRVARLRSEFSSGRVTSEPQFARAMQEMVKPPPALRAVGWAPSQGPCAYAWVRDEQETEIRPGMDLRRRTGWSIAMGRAQSERELRLSMVQLRNGQPEIGAVIPVFVGEGTAAAYLGSLVLRLDLRGLLSGLLDEPTLAHFDVEVSDTNTVVLSRGAAIAREDEQASAEAMKVANRFFWVRTCPTGHLQSMQTGRSAAWVLWAGGPGSLGIAWAVWWALARRARAGDEARRQVRALEELTQTAGHIAAAPGARGNDVLNTLAEAARRILGTTSASIALIDLKQNRITMVAADGFTSPEMPRTMSLDQASGSKLCASTKQVLLVENAATDPRVNSQALIGMGMYAVMFVPLVVEREAIGVLYFSHGRPRRFSAAEVRLGKLLGSQAAVTLANYRLATQKDAALQSQQQHQAQREALYQVSSEIYRFDHLDESLQQLADAAPAILGVDLCLVVLGTGVGLQVRIHAITGNYAHCRWEVADATGTPAEDAWRKNTPLVVEDASQCSNMHPAYRHRLHIGSAMYLPLKGSKHQPIGVMILIGHEPGSFSQEQTELAAVLAARASSAIEQVKLYEEARRYAKSQAMLLSELNHRVKNNLAGIVTLLTVGRPPMPENIRLWLNRVTARVQTMARAHELFVGGNSSVGLGELVQKLLPSFEVIKPPGAQIEVDVEDSALQLDTDRAVSLAMVINELCWNALEHGSGAHGVLQIRARAGAPGHAVIEIEDEGSNAQLAQPVATEGDAGRPRGMGLRLVEGLVRRELNGTFSMEHRPAGGTLARIEIPLAIGSGGD